MTQEEILEGNKIIAEFMGLIEVESKYSKLLCFYYPCKEGYMSITDEDFESEDFDITTYAWTIYNLSYHNSYDWLMPVVEKIESLPMVEYFEISHRIKIGIYSDNYVISLWRNEDGFGAFRYLPDESDLVPILSIQGKNQISKIEAIWLAVIEFIKWYNLNKE